MNPRKKRGDRGRENLELLAASCGGAGVTVGVHVHPSPDPDALGSGWGAAVLLEGTGARAQLICRGSISHPQCALMQGAIGVPFTKPDQVRRDRTLIVDACVQNSDLDSADAVVDHHGADGAEGAGAAIIESVGACSTLIAEMLRHQGQDLTGRLRDLATALSFGIYSDTDGLLSAGTTPRDVEAFGWLRERADHSMMRDFVNYSLPEIYFEMERRVALPECSRLLVNSAFIGDAGFVPEGRRNCLAMLSERALRREGIELSLVFGAVGGDIHASARSRGSAIDAETMCRSLFGDAHAGGRKGYGGARAPLHPIDLGCGPGGEALWTAIRDNIFSRAERILRGD
jgi:nanoRNase/pAp phosphatase (c-di-AMP/oligoRNAs hydrolase)